MLENENGSIRHINLIGGTKGLGKVFNNVCKAQGWKTSMVARSSSDEAENIFSCDVTRIENIKSCLHSIFEKNGKIDALVFFQRWRGEADSWNGHFDVSVKATDNYISECLKYMDKNSGNDKSIVIISSISSLFVTGEQDIAYHASRSAQVGMTRYLANSLGKYGIRVNAISFGNILKETNVDFFSDNQRLKNSFEQCSALNRMGTSLEIASVIKFLVSTDSSWITGQNILVDGGSSLAWSESRVRQSIEN